MYMFLSMKEKYQLINDRYKYAFIFKFDCNNIIFNNHVFFFN